ncbi:hypothetical protein O181_119673 [Austropuccinia psidii MF-1]|uniref:Uncharacterized protein n=1 Tax=Austropuccinia psidii MF-1 TaxID=1389203 RepID=A0A9Q3KEB8_9BASI|nr:hypothetical protein [Austropuccinia psidii MF-1]
MDHQILAAKYKSVLKKVRPVNEPMPQDLNPPLERPPLSRVPYETPLSPNPPIFEETFKVTNERLQAVNFGPPGWLSNEKINLLKSVITLREKVIAFCEEERGLLKHSYGKPYKIPVIPHKPWQKKPIPIPNKFFLSLLNQSEKESGWESMSNPPQATQAQSFVWPNQMGNSEVSMTFKNSTK